MAEQLPDRLLRPADVARRLGVSIPTTWRYLRLDPSFPRSIKLSARVTVFSERAIDAWVAERAAVPA